LFWSCKLYQLNPNVDSQIKDLLTKTGTPHAYKKGPEPLKITVHASQSNQYGRISEIYLDRKVRVWNQEKGDFHITVTSKFDIQIFEKDPTFPNYIGVFCSAKVAASLYTAMLGVSHEAQENTVVPYFDVHFLLKEKETELRKLFDNMTELSIDGVRDQFVKKVTFKGKNLGESDVYEKYVMNKDIGGSVQFFGVHINDRTVVLVSEGAIYTRRGSSRDESLETIMMCVKNLQAAKALWSNPVRL
jgi:hypothetical protein